MHPVGQFIVVLLTFLTMGLAVVGGIVLILRTSKSSMNVSLIASLVIATTFGLGSLILILISTKFENWTFMNKLAYAGEIFLWTFVGSIFLLPIALQRARRRIERNETDESQE